MDKKADVDAQLTPLQQDAMYLLFALQDAWPYVHNNCTIKVRKERISALLKKHGDFADLHNAEELDAKIRAVAPVAGELSDEQIDVLMRTEFGGHYDDGTEIGVRLKDVLRRAVRVALAAAHKPAVPDGWVDAYAAFQGAFDTPLARRKDDGEYAKDARRRLREFNAAVLAAAPQAPAAQAETKPGDALDASRYRALRDADPDAGPFITEHKCNGWGRWYYDHKTGDDADKAADALIAAAPAAQDKGADA